ncbi:MAG: hypothetical protein ACI9KE_001635 [Polyangiales bacterium]|jgi:hypothetical protein
MRIWIALFTLCAACSDDAPGVDASPPDVGHDAIDVMDAGVEDAEDPFDGGPPGFDGGPLALFDAGDITLPSTELCEGAEAPPYADPDTWPRPHGPGLPTAEFEDDALFENCAYLDGGELDTSDHHNLVTMYDGYLLMPWAPEYGRGGLTFFDISDACSPTAVGSGWSQTMRETHSIGFSHEGGAFAVTASMSMVLEYGGGGIQFWNVEDTSAPEHIVDLDVPAFFYPDAYGYIVMSSFWQVPFVYLGAGFNGVYIVDATNPTSPVLASQYAFDPPIRVGQVQAVGNLLIVTATGGARTVLLDISNPTSPRAIPGGDFQAVDAEGTAREAYFSNFSGGIVYYARKDEGGGLVAMDVRDPSAPVYHGGISVPGSGGYVFLQHDRAYVGMGSRAAIFDITDPRAMTEVQELNLAGDLDTFTPLGNIGVLSVDADAGDNQGSAIVPIAVSPDNRPPVVNFVWPRDGATGVAVSSRVGVTLDEHVEVRSAFDGSVRLYETESGRRVAGVVSAQEGFINFHPRCPLATSTTYTLELPAGGVTDFSGNALIEAFASEFRTGP